MAMPDESSVFCDNCSGYNIQCSSILEVGGELFCESCIERLGGKKLLKQLKTKVKNELQKESKR